MAVTSIVLADLAASLWLDTAQSNAAIAMTTASTVIYMIDIDNTMNGAEAEYVKIWNTAGAVTVGTTVPDLVLPIAANVRRQLVYPEGLTLGTGVAVATVTTGGTGGTTAPGSAITVRIVFT